MKTFGKPKSLGYSWNKMWHCLPGNQRFQVVSGAAQIRTMISKIQILRCLRNATIQEDTAVIVTMPASQLKVELGREVGIFSQGEIFKMGDGCPTPVQGA